MKDPNLVQVVRLGLPRPEAQMTRPLREAGIWRRIKDEMGRMCWEGGGPGDEPHRLPPDEPLRLDVSDWPEGSIVSGWEPLA